jgi:hypothetical protein
MLKLKSFRSFNEERVNSIVLTFGRFQPPTVGHEKLINKVASLATKGNDYRIFTSQTNDEKKNPLAYSDKIKFLRKMFPKHGRNIIEDTSIRDIFSALVKIHKQNFTKVVLVVGSDRVDEFKRLLNKYNGVEAKHGLYSFPDGIQVVSSGDRDPDSDDIEGMSASKMRAAASDNNMDAFTKGLPKDFKEGPALFNAVRVGMGLKEAWVHRQHIQLDPVSDEREEFVKGSLFEIGDRVRIIETNEEGTIDQLGPNFVVVETLTGKSRKWITSVEKLK